MSSLQHIAQSNKEKPVKYKSRNKSQARLFYEKEVKRRHPAYPKWPREADHLFEEEIRKVETKIEKEKVFENAVLNLNRALLGVSAYEDNSWRVGDSLTEQRFISWTPGQKKLSDMMAAIGLRKIRADIRLWYMPYEDFKAATSPGLEFVLGAEAAMELGDPDDEIQLPECYLVE
ncbi:hypothetical protein FRC17_004410 [Serendipita sp. 399]|nr:hypothetical protein FRC17_004410 [Serendipita sp. 399]